MKFSRAFESSSWRVLRHPSTSYQFSHYNSTHYDEASRNMFTGSIFLPANRRMRSTFLIHPHWV